MRKNIFWFGIGNIGATPRFFTIKCVNDGSTGRDVKYFHEGVVQGMEGRK